MAVTAGLCVPGFIRLLWEVPGSMLEQLTLWFCVLPSVLSDYTLGLGGQPPSLIDGDEICLALTLEVSPNARHIRPGASLAS